MGLHGLLQGSLFPFLFSYFKVGENFCEIKYMQQLICEETAIVCFNILRVRKIYIGLYSLNYIFHYCCFLPFSIAANSVISSLKNESRILCVTQEQICSNEIFLAFLEPNKALPLLFLN
jgi:hypothetical protein